MTRMISRSQLLVALCSLAACGASHTAAARFPGAPPAFDRAATDPKALELADQVLTATGGREHWEAIKQVRWSQTITHEGKPPLEGEQSWDRWNAREYGRVHRGDTDVVVMRELYGSQAVALGARGQSMQKLAREDAKTALDFATKRFSLDHAALCMPALLEAPGTKDSENQTREALKVEFDPKDGVHSGIAFRLLVAPDTHLVAQLEIIQAAGTSGYKLSQWVDVGGLKFPTVENNLGDPTEQIAFKDIRVGEPEEALYTPVTR
jgi:hypothetical protein